MACQLDALEQEPTQGGAEDRREHHRHADRAHDLGQVLGPDRLHEDRHAGRDEHAAADALQRPEGDELAEPSVAKPHRAEPSGEQDERRM